MVLSLILLFPWIELWRRYFCEQRFHKIFLQIFRLLRNVCFVITHISFWCKIIYASVSVLGLRAPSPCWLKLAEQDPICFSWKWKNKRKWKNGKMEKSVIFWFDRGFDLRRFDLRNSNTPIMSLHRKYLIISEMRVHLSDLTLIKILPEVPINARKKNLHKFW